MATINRDMGRDLFYQYRGYFGFGERTGIDLPGEESVSSPAVMYPYSRLHALEMATSAMGQGFNATTIQTITGYTALINGGDLMRPYLVSQIVDSRNTIVYENEPAVVRRVISPETSAIMRYELEQVVARRPGRADELAGSGFRAYIAGHTIGGKTGTAQQGARDAGNHNLSFVAFMPVNNPQYLVLMTIDHIEDSRRYGGDTVTPIVREFFLDLIRLKGIRPTTNDDDNAIATELIGNPMPDFTGVRVSDAVRNILNRRTVGYQVVGGGTTVSHTWPAADQQFPTSNPVILYTDPDTRISERMVSVPNVTNLRAENAEFLLTEAGLIPILFQETRTNNIIPDSVNDRTAQPEPATNSTPAPINYTVYQQYPTPGTEIEQGTQVMIRAR
jgi:stage V sporulation protein D (sporulation-specific penicillin-binding protein)